MNHNPQDFDDCQGIDCDNRVHQGELLCDDCDARSVQALRKRRKMYRHQLQEQLKKLASG